MFQPLDKYETETDDTFSVMTEDRERAESIVREVSYRNIEINKENLTDEGKQKFAGNTISTSKYTCLNFFPKNLIYQFTKMANIYFLVMTGLQMIPTISITGGQPTILVPLTFVTLVSMVKDIVEDLKRHKQDNTENNS